MSSTSSPLEVVNVCATSVKAHPTQLMTQRSQLTGATTFKAHVRDESWREPPLGRRYLARGVVQQKLKASAAVGAKKAPLGGGTMCTWFDNSCMGGVVPIWPGDAEPDWHKNCGVQPHGRLKGSVAQPYHPGPQ
eukprot:3817750-Amphidinium_carterae.1